MPSTIRLRPGAVLSGSYSPTSMPLDKYARPERERRFLLDHLPGGSSEPRRIRDRYLTGTRLRLRRIEDLSGNVEQLKLGHKVRPDESDPRLVLHTSLYLSPDEFEVLSQLPGDELVKVRYHLGTDPLSAVDVFEGSLAGLILLEVDFQTEADLAAYAPPDFAGPEVTNDEAFTGNGLAGAVEPPLQR